MVSTEEDCQPMNVAGGDNYAVFEDLTVVSRKNDVQSGADDTQSSTAAGESLLHNIDLKVW